MQKFITHIFQKLDLPGYKSGKTPCVNSIVKENSTVTPDPVIDNDEVFQRIYRGCREHTMTSKERMYALYKAVRYVIKAKISGDFVECGVWRGGSMMLTALTLLEISDTSRTLYLFDTFTGMPEPTKEDTLLSDKSMPAKQVLKNNPYERCVSSLPEVKSNMLSTGYPKDKTVFVKGKVETCIPKTMPGKIALLRLDTDWYKSTKHELIYLFPLVSNGGVLIVDDYGHWAGSKKAVDEYFSSKPILLNRVDYTGVIGVRS